jgi:hypothetical protein
MLTRIVKERNWNSLKGLPSSKAAGTARRDRGDDPAPLPKRGSDSMHASFSVRARTTASCKAQRLCQPASSDRDMHMTWEK